MKIAITRAKADGSIIRAELFSRYNRSEEEILNRIEEINNIKDGYNVIEVAELEDNSPLLECIKFLMGDKPYEKSYSRRALASEIKELHDMIEQTYNELFDMGCAISSAAKKAEDLLKDEGE